MIGRTLTRPIQERMFQGKAILLIGARQVGKTTLLKQWVQGLDDSHLWLNCDEPDLRLRLTNPTSTQLKELFGKTRIVVIDEAQRVRNIGLTLKLITDELSHVQLLVSGSSALELSDHINEPLTGRKFEFFLYPLSHSELVGEFGSIHESRLLEDRLIYGSYPDIVVESEHREELLSQLAGSYLYKDLFNYQDIRKPEVLRLLLEALALQVGNQVSWNELAQTVGSDQATVRRYVDLLEKAFVLFPLRAFSRNVRNELKKSRKIYFFDNGIRNALVRNFNPLSLRSDTGALWENYLISERFKYNMYTSNHCHSRFWRTTQQQEVDYLEEKGGRLTAYEFKWNPKTKVRFPRTFTQAYPDCETHLITTENFRNFVGT